MRKIVHLSPWGSRQGGVVGDGIGERYEEDGQVVGHKEKLVQFIK